MRVAAIVAMDRNRLIGNETGLPWRLPVDLRRFRELTWGKPVIVGRRTQELIGGPLKGRHHVVLTRRPGYLRECCDVAGSFAEALRLAEIAAARAGVDEIMVIGGAEVYREAAPVCGRLYLTVVDGRFAGDTFFPVELYVGPWRTVREERFPADAKNAHPHWFLILER